MININTTLLEESTKVFHLGIKSKEPSLFQMGDEFVRF